jgi:hypothetical protein
MVVLVPRVVDVSPVRCPDATEAERAEANAWVKRLTPAENTRRGIKDKLDEHAVSQVRKNAMINSLIADKATCRGETQKASS